MSELVIAEKNDIVNIANEVRRLTGQAEGLNLQEMQTELKSIDNQPDWNQNDPNAKNYIKNRPGAGQGRLHHVRDWREPPGIERMVFQQQK